MSFVPAVIAVAAVTFTVWLFFGPQCPRIDSQRQHRAHGDRVFEDSADRATLLNLLERMTLPPRQLLREKGTPYAELKLGEPHWTDEEIVDQMLKFPILINRPIVVTERGVRLCRPSEAVLDLLPLPQKGPFTKEDGERVIDDKGQRVKSS